MSTFAIRLCATGHEDVLSAHQPSSITGLLPVLAVRPLVFTFRQRTSDRPPVLYCFVEALWKVWKKLNGKIKRSGLGPDRVLWWLFSNTMYVGFSWPAGELREHYPINQYDDCMHIIILLNPSGHWTQVPPKPSDLERKPSVWPFSEYPWIDSKNTTLPSSGFTLRVVEYEYDDVTYRYSDKNVSYHSPM